VSATRLTLTLALLLACATAWGQLRRGEPYAGYVYPSGCRQGTTVHVTVGGQNLRGARALSFTGTGLTVKIIEHVRPLSNKERSTIAQYIRLYASQRMAEALGRAPKMPAQGGQQKELDPLPDHPWTRGMDKMTLRQLDELRQKLFDPKRQPNAQLGEWVLMDVTAAANAAPGVRELRLITPQGGLTNPVRFVVGTVPEALEQEPNDPQSLPTAALPTPTVLNGQILPGDVDRFRLKAKQGQKLLIQAQARSLTPYLADAVPGWFQAVLSLHDAAGQEVAYDDDYRFSPDPVLFYTVPQDGDYTVQIADSIYRGREDFVYRISVTERPFVTHMFPLGGQVGAPVSVTIGGWNLAPQPLKLDTAPGPEGLREIVWRGNEGYTNVLHYAVDSLPDALEAEPNDSAAQAQKITLPMVLNGRIGKAGDVDTFRFEGRAGEEIVAEVAARRLDSPLDSLVRVMDSTGKVLALNDDHEDKGAGWLTHHADSVVTVKLPQAGSYTVSIMDAQQHGGDEYAYRLRISAPRPDFELRMTPSSLSLLAGRAETFTVYALRQDGFAGEIEITTAGGPPGFVVSGGRIPPGRDRIQMTLTAPMAPLEQPLTLSLQGRAQIAGQAVTRPVVPAEDMMQAFAYRQLVPAETLTALVMGARRFAPEVTLANANPVRLPAGGTVQLQLQGKPNPLLKNIRLELGHAPEGVTVGELKQSGNNFTLELRADAQTAKVGTVDNLIVKVSTETEIKGRDDRVRTFRAPLGCLPAIPCEIVK
jgi:hypothetical protein